MDSPSVVKEDLATGARIFYGWWIAAASAFSLSLSIGTLAVYSFSLFVKPLSQEFGWSRGKISFAMTLTNIAVSLISPLLGRLADRFGSRAVLITAHLFLGLTLGCFYFLSAPLWHLYALYFCVGILGAGTSPLAYARLVTKWFDNRRGLALGLTMAGVGVGSFVIPSLAQWLLSNHGWRITYVAMGIAAAAIPVPLITLVLRESPVSAARPGTPRTAGVLLTEALGTRAFWQMTAVFSSVATCAYAAVAHMVPILTDRGIPVQHAAFALSLFGISAMVGRILTGTLMDRFFAPYVAAVMFAGVAAGLPLLISGVSYPAAILVGLGLGAEVDVMPYLVSRYFGLRSLGEIYGLIFASFTLGIAIGPYLMGAGFDASRSYTLPLTALVCVMALAVVGTLTLPRYPLTTLRPSRTPCWRF
jgi:MFS family permease